MKGVEERAEETLTKIVGRLETSRSKLLEALRNHTPLVVLSSLSLVVAGFLRDGSPDAAGFAASAAFIFLLVLISSVIQEFTSPNYYLLTVIYVGIVVGFILLLLSVQSFLRELPNAFVGYHAVITSGSIVILAVIDVRVLMLQIDTLNNWERTDTTLRRMVPVVLGFQVFGTAGMIVFWLLLAPYMTTPVPRPLALLSVFALPALIVPIVLLGASSERRSDRRKDDRESPQEPPHTTPPVS